MNWLNKIDDILDRFLPPTLSNNTKTEKDEGVSDTIHDESEEGGLQKEQDDILQHSLVNSTPSIDNQKIYKNDVYFVTSIPLQNKKLPGVIKSTRRLRVEPITKEISLNDDNSPASTKDTTAAQEEDRPPFTTEASLQPSFQNTFITDGNRLRHENQELSSCPVVEDTTKQIMPQNTSALSLNNSDNMNPSSIRDEIIPLPVAFISEENGVQHELSVPISSFKQEHDVQSTDQQSSTSIIEDMAIQQEPTLPIISSLRDDQEEDSSVFKIEETLVRQDESSSSTLLNHPYSSSETLEDGKDSASMAFDFVRNQAQSLRAVMGDLDYAFEQAIEDDNIDDGDSTSNMTEEEGDDYNYGDHIVPWALDRIVDPDSRPSEVQSSFSDHPDFHPSMNCHGVFHIRLIRAQHLPCAPKSTIQTIISLPPWKGKIKTQSGQTYKGPSRAGTCFRWNSQDSIHEQSEDSTCFSMIHTYNNQETPIPSIVIQLKDASYPMFEKELFSLTLCCKPLMKSPCTWRRKWCVADTQYDSKRKMGKVDNEILKDDTSTGMMMTPLILLEAVFEPTNFADAHPKAVQPYDYDPIRMEPLAQDESSQVSESPPRRNMALSEASSVSSSTAGISTTHTLIRKGLSSKPHLFRIASTWKPGHCGVCSVTTGLWNRYYQCEVCGLDCCSDCQLRVDLELPCGSEAAEIKVNQAKDSKITFRRVMAILAPIREEDQMKNSDRVISSPNAGVQSKTIGTLNVKVHRAVLFQKTFPAEVDVVDMYKIRDRWSRVGDYYVRISWSDGNGDNKRTKTVFQTSSPIFESDEISIPVKTYGSEYLIEAIDANTDKAIGATLLTTQGVLQWQRDESVSNDGIRFHSILSYPIRPPTIKRTLELRVPWKHGFGLEFYKTGKINDTNQAGEVTGLIDIDLSLEENTSLFSFTNPTECPERPTHDFNIDFIQIHIARIKALVDDIYGLLDAYYFLVSWDNRALTSFSLLIFATTCLTLKAEYIGSLPVFILLVTMIYLCRIRAKGDFMTRWIKKEVKNRKGETQTATSKTNIYRPAGTLELGVGRGQNLISQHGLPGSVVVQILLDPTAFLDEKMKNKVGEIDPSSKCIYHVGTTESCGVTSFPKWKNVIRSEEFERLKSFLPGHSILDEITITERDKSAIIYGNKNDECPKVTLPILQPIIESPIKQYDSDGNVIDSNTIDLVPWESSPAGIIFRVRFSDVLNRSLFEEKLGDVIVPMSEIALQGEIQGWYPVTNGFPTTITASSEGSLYHNQRILVKTNDDVDGKNLDKDVTPSLFISAKLSLPGKNLPSEVEKETSIAIEEEYIRSSYHILNPRLGIIESSINTLTSVRGVGENVLYLQNQLGYMLDLLEMIRNLFNFSCPEKSMLLLSLLFFSWLILILIPTRVVILCLGLGQYAYTFMSAFYYKTESSPVMTTESNDAASDASPVLTWLINFLFSTPTDEDLRRCYFWETRRHAEQDLAKITSIRRSARLTKLWKASWFGPLELRRESNLVLDDGFEWENIFAIILGHRFLWWRSEKHFDQGEKPIGRILFSGHSGLSGLSPLELRLLKNVNLSNVVGIFGRGETEQVKITVMTSDQHSKEALENAVIQACLDSKVD